MKVSRTPWMHVWCLVRGLPAIPVSIPFGRRRICVPSKFRNWLSTGATLVPPMGSFRGRSAARRKAMNRPSPLANADPDDPVTAIRSASTPAHTSEIVACGGLVAQGAVPRPLPTKSLRGAPHGRVSGALRADLRLFWLIANLIRCIRHYYLLWMSGLAPAWYHLP
jgi:hypothetical protein